MRFNAAVTAGGVTFNSSASLALIGVWFSSSISQTVFRSSSCDTLVFWRFNIPLFRYRSSLEPLTFFAPALPGAVPVLSPQSLSQFCDAPVELPKDSLINLGVRAIGIIDVPILDFGNSRKDLFSWTAAHIDDQIRGTQDFPENRLGRQFIPGIPVVLESLPGHPLNMPQRRQACA